MDGLQILTKDLSYVEIEQIKNSKNYKCVKVKQLSKLEEIANCIKDSSVSCKNICISERAIVINNKVFSLDSGIDFEVFKIE